MKSPRIENFVLSQLFSNLTIVEMWVRRDHILNDSKLLQKLIPIPVEKAFEFSTSSLIKFDILNFSTFHSFDFHRMSMHNCFFREKKITVPYLYVFSYGFYNW